MLTATLIASLIFIVIASIGIGVLYLRSWREYRGKRVLTCPETRLPVGAEVDAARAARGALVDNPRFVITSCSRWPERAGCDQACAAQVEASARETLACILVRLWFEEHPCVYCGKTIAELGNDGILPALRGPDGKLREWSRVSPEELPELFRNAVAVCAICDLVESFRSDFPELVTEREHEVAEFVPLRSTAVY